MGLKEYLHDIWEAVATTAKGMRITARYGVDPRETITLQYPEERWEPAERFRGFLHNDIKKCTSCSMCVKVCPVDCIALEAVRGADKKLVLVSYEINIGRCMYCGLCVEVCPTKCLTHTSGYEKATVSRGELILPFVFEEADAIKARVAKQVAEAAAKAEAEKAAKAEAEKAKEGGTPDVSPEAPAGAKGDASGVPEKKGVPPVAQPAEPAFAARNPAAGDDGEKNPAPEPKGEPAKPEESPEEGGGKTE
jgi:formate hydrogenlyase subunit 6/NADH:ubiquinone oxidoreductase subunit I